MNRDAAGKFAGAPKEPLKRDGGFTAADFIRAAASEFRDARICFYDSVHGISKVHSIQQINNSDGSTVILLTRSHWK